MNRDLLVVFDGECGLCRAARQWAEERDRRGRLRFVPYQDADLARLAPGLTPAQAARSLYAIAPDGQRYRGARAVFMTLRSLPGAWGLLGTVWALPPLSLLAEPFYRLVARHRVAVSRWLGLTQCRLEAPAERP